jgi:hypothetical protein
VTGKFFNKKYVQKWSRFFISNFPKKCMSVYTVQANKGDEVTHFHTDTIYRKHCAYGLFSSYAFFTRATEKFKSFKISYKCK